jgi:antitoxin ParD1/3/4
MGVIPEATMTLSLPSDLTHFIEDQVSSGRFRSADQVIEAGLRLLREKEAELRDLIAVGVEQADRGEVAPFDPLAVLAEVKAARARRTGSEPCGG